MSHCEHCGAPLERDFTSQATCEFCGRVNAPLQREVEVPVPVQVVQKVVQVVGGVPAAEDKELRCPHCRKRLVSVIAKEVELAGCGGCGGIWIDNASARQVLERPESIFAELARRAGDNARNRGVRGQSPGCPVCTAVLDRAVMKGIELDVCDEHGTWFDPFELGVLVDALNGKARDPDFHPGDTRKIRCASCKQPITADRANITGDGLTCEACWRSLQTKQIVEYDRSMQQAGAVAVGGALLGIAAVMLGASRRA